MTGRFFNPSGDFRLIAPSRAGARRTPIHSGLTFAQQADAYAQLLDSLGIEKTIVLALSAGGISALQFALDYPERCEALILVSAVSPIIAQLHVPKALLSLLDAFMASDYFVWLVQKMSMGFIFASQGTNQQEFSDDNAVYSLVENIFPSSDWSENVRNDIQQILELDDFPFEDIRVPTLLLHGDADPTVSLKVAQTTTERIPNAELYVVPNGSHLMIGSDSDTLNEQFSLFLKKHNIIA